MAEAGKICADDTGKILADGEGRIIMHDPAAQDCSCTDGAAIACVNAGMSQAFGLFLDWGYTNIVSANYANYLGPGSNTFQFPWPPSIHGVFPGCGLPDPGPFPTWGNRTFNWCDLAPGCPEDGCGLGASGVGIPAAALGQDGIPRAHVVFVGGQYVVDAVAVYMITKHRVFQNEGISPLVEARGCECNPFGPNTTSMADRLTGDYIQVGADRFDPPDPEYAILGFGVVRWQLLDFDPEKDLRLVDPAFLCYSQVRRSKIGSCTISYSLSQVSRLYRGYDCDDHEERASYFGPPTSFFVPRGGQIDDVIHRRFELKAPYFYEQFDKGCNPGDEGNYQSDAGEAIIGYGFIEVFD